MDDSHKIIEETDLEYENPIKTAWDDTRRQSKGRHKTFGKRSNYIHAASSGLRRAQNSTVDEPQEEEDEGGLDSSQTSLDILPVDRISESSSSLPSFSAAPCMNSSDAWIISNSLQRDVPPIPGRPTKPHRRSLSMSFHRPIPPGRPIKRASTSSNEQDTTSHRSSTASNTIPDSFDLFDLKENSHPNSSQSRGESARKRFRGGRRNSMSSSMPRSGSLSALQHSSLSNANSISVNSLSCPPPPKLCRRNSLPTSHTDWFPTDADPSFAEMPIMWNQPQRSFNSFTPSKIDDHEDFAEVTERSSPGSFSVTNSSGSSRKRPMNEDDNDGYDGFSSNVGFSFSNGGSSFANASPSPATRPAALGAEMPMGPSLLYSTYRFEQEDDAYLRKGRAMQIDSDDEEDEDTDGDDQDASPDDSILEESGSDSSPSKESVDSRDITGVISLPVVKTKEEVLESMPCYDDLKFLIRELRKATKGASMQLFGTTRSCAVTPGKNWPPERRAKFILWTSKQLGFNIHSATASVKFLQIPLSKGQEVLNLLLSALVLKKEQEEAIKPNTTELTATSPFILDTSSDLNSATKKNQAQAMAPPVLDLASIPDSSEMGLVQGFNSLCLNNDQPLIRRVTQEAVKNASMRPTTIQMDCSPRPHAYRPSIESHYDLTSHIHGLSPAAAPPSKLRRPPRLSFPGNCSSHANPAKHTENTPVMNSGLNTCSSVASQQTTYEDLLTTPLMKQNTAWGSRPVAGRDWGNSAKVDHTELASVNDLLKEALIAAGQYVASEDTFNSISALPAVRTSDLCLDLEVGNECCDSDDEIDQSAPMVAKGIAALYPYDILAAVPRPSSAARKENRRRHSSLAKHKRVAVCGPSRISQRKTLFETNRQSYPQTHRPYLSTCAVTFKPSVEKQEPLEAEQQPLIETLAEKNLLPQVLSFLEDRELLTTVSLVCTSWADAATDAYAELMLASVGCLPTGKITESDDYDEETGELEDEIEPGNSIARSMERSWKDLLTNFPYASFLSEGAFKRVYKVKNSVLKAPEAVSIMDVEMIESTGNKAVVGTELAVSVMLSSLARRGICPNFVVTRGVFTCAYAPPASHWGSAKNKNHDVHLETPKARRLPKEPGAKQRGRYQYIRMELCTKGDAEEYIKEQPDSLLSVDMARNFLFQICFGLHAAASKFSLKHYDLKLLNIFLQDASNVPGAKSNATGDVVLRYGLGSKNFALRMPAGKSLIAKLADYGTADVKSESNGQPVSLAQITTLENTPPEFLIIGDAARQGHAHDLFGLGLCMLHLFTGKAPYEEILEDVKCPQFFKQTLRDLWEDESVTGYSVIRSVILSEVYKDETGNIVEGQPDETFYDTLYRFLVLFGIPKQKFQRKEYGKVWKAISDSFEVDKSNSGKDAAQFARDQRKYSLSHGTNAFIRRARNNLQSTKGAMELLLSLVTFDPERRASTLDVLNSDFFEPLTEVDPYYRDCDDVRSFRAFAI